MQSQVERSVINAIAKDGIEKVLTICSQAILDCGHEDLALAIRVVRNICREKNKELKRSGKKLGS